MNDFTIRVGANIRRLREEQGMTIDELAKRLGMSQPNLSKIERGEPKKVDYLLLDRMATALNVQPSDITGWQDKNAQQEKHEQHLQHRYDKAFDDYSKLSFESQKIVNGVIKSLLHHAPTDNTEEEILRKLRYITEEARDRVLHQLEYEYEAERKKQNETSA